jgi:hypothetical protein
VEKPKPRGLPLARLEAFDVGDLHRFGEGSRIVAGVVGQDHRGLMREALDEVLGPQRGRIHPEVARPDLDQALHHEGRLRTAGAPIGIDGRGIGVDRIDLAIDRRDVVLARQQRGIEIGRDRRGEG